MIYLDNNATTRLDPRVLEEMLPFLTERYGNPSSGYRFGADMRAALDLARERVAALLGCEPREIVWTSGGTEANNAALASAVQLDPTRPHLVTTAVEHSAVWRYAEMLAKRGAAVTVIGVDSAGRLDLAELEQAIRPETALVTAMWANNETGVLFPIEEIAEIAAHHRVPFHTDAVQLAGKLPIRLADSRVQSLALSAHKLHGPKGVGALFISRRARFRPLLIGGGQENGRRSGTENVAGIVAFGKAAELAAAELAGESMRVRTLRDRLEQTLRAQLPGVSVNGDVKARLPNTSSLAFRGIEAAGALILLDEKNLCCSAGSACHTGSLAPSHVLTAMGFDAARARGSLRFSFSRFNTEAEVEAAIPIIVQAITKLRQLSGIALPAELEHSPA